MGRVHEDDDSSIESNEPVAVNEEALKLATSQMNVLKISCKGHPIIKAHKNDPVSLTSIVHKKNNPVSLTIFQRRCLHHTTGCQRVIFGSSLISANLDLHWFINAMQRLVNSSSNASAAGT